MLSILVAYVAFPLINKLKKVAFLQSETTATIEIPAVVGVHFLRYKTAGLQTSIMTIAARRGILERLPPDAWDPPCLIAAQKKTAVVDVALIPIHPRATATSLVLFIVSNSVLVAVPV